MLIPDMCLRCGEDSCYPHFHPGIERYWYCLNCRFEINEKEYARRNLCTLSQEEEKIQEGVIARAKLIARRPHKCDWCGRTSGMMHGAHVITVAREGTCADPDNIMCLCYVCHFYKWHKSPHDAAQWFDATYPGRYKRLRKKADSGEKYSTEYWKSLYVELCKK
jgi:hypothetical protein